MCYNHIMKPNFSLESKQNPKVINTIVEFKKRINDAINIFQALRLSLIDSSFESIMDDLRKEPYFTHFEDYIYKQGKYVLSKNIKESQIEIINKYDEYIEKVLKATDLSTLEEIYGAAISFLKKYIKEK